MLTIKEANCCEKILRVTPLLTLSAKINIIV